MKTIIRKLFYNYEKEEKWLNEMSAKGFALTDYTWCRYVFTDCQPGEYIYRLELLEHSPTHAVSQKYIQFMEENGVEHISSYIRWVFFRKKAADGAFDIYSDADSKIKHYRMVIKLFTSIAIAAFGACVYNIYVSFLIAQRGIYPFNFVVGAIVGFLGVYMMFVGRSFHRKIKKLKKDKEIME